MERDRNTERKIGRDSDRKEGREREGGMKIGREKKKEHRDITIKPKQFA